jgi:hypothetical protein
MEINNLLKSNKLSIDEFKEKFPLFLSIILGVLVSIPCGFILANTFRLYDCFVEYVWYMDYYMILLYIFCNILFGLISGIAISYGIKRHKYKNKKNLFILIVFCSFLIYFVFSIIFMYILFRTGDRCYDMLTYKDLHIYSLQHKNYNVSLKEFLLYTLGHWPLFWYDTGCNCVISVIIDQLSFLLHMGPYEWMEKPGALVWIVTINSFLLFTQFLITIFCTWTYIIVTCPWLYPMDQSDMENKSWYASLIKAIRRRIM